VIYQEDVYSQDKALLMFQKQKKVAMKTIKPGLVQIRCEKGSIDEDFSVGGYVFGPDGTCLASMSDWSEGYCM